VPSNTTELGSGTADAAVVTLNTNVLPPNASNPLDVEPVKDKELAVEVAVKLALELLLKAPDTYVTPVIGVVKLIRLTVKVPAFPLVVPKNVKVTCVPVTVVEPVTPLPLEQEFGGPTQKPGPAPGTVKGPVFRFDNVILGVSLPLAL